MSQEKKEKINIMELITPETDESQLREIVEKLLTPDDMQMLGGKEAAAQKVVDSIAYLGVFASEPATFDELAFDRTATLGLPKNEAKRILEIDGRIGVYKTEAEKFRGEKRFSISEEQANIYKRFLT